MAPLLNNPKHLHGGITGIKCKFLCFFSFQAQLCFEVKKFTLNPDAVPSLFSFVKPQVKWAASEARSERKAKQQVILICEMNFKINRSAALLFPAFVSHQVLTFHSFVHSFIHPTKLVECFTKSGPDKSFFIR